MCKRVSTDISSFQVCYEACSVPCKLYLSVQDSRRSVCVSDSDETSCTLALLIDGIFGVGYSVIICVRFQIAGKGSFR